MNPSFFSSNFNFRILNFEQYHYTDNRAGSPMHYLARMTKGHARIVAAHKTIDVAEGDVFFIPHKLSYQSYWYGVPHIQWLSYGFLDLEACEKINFELQVIPCGEALKEKVSQIPLDGASLRCETLGHFYQVLSELLPYLNRHPTLSKKELLIDAAKKYMAADTACSIAEIAEKCCISEPYLYLIFKEKSSCTPNEYRLKLICQKGIDYLTTTDKTVEEISTQIGLSSAAHFRKLLKMYTGLTPREIRRNSVMP